MAGVSKAEPEAETELVKDSREEKQGLTLGVRFYLLNGKQYSIFNTR